LKDLELMLRGKPRGKSRGYYKPETDPFTRFRLSGMQAALNLYTRTVSATHGQWRRSGLQAALGLGRGQHCA
jgi:hypothetical protein